MSQPAVKRQRNTEMLRAPSVRDVGMSMLLLLAGRASVLGLFPFGVAFFASCFDKSIAYLGITVLSIALMTSAGSAVLTKYLVAALLFWIYTRAGLRLRRRGGYGRRICFSYIYICRSIRYTYAFC